MSNRVKFKVRIGVGENELLDLGLWLESVKTESLILRILTAVAPVQYIRGLFHEKLQIGMLKSFFS